MTAQVRKATAGDLESILALHLDAFPDQENRLVAALAERLLLEPSAPETLNLVVDSNGEVLGHVAFSPCLAGNGVSCLAYLLAPLAVRPGHQKTGLGAKLVENGMDTLTRRGVDMLLVYGDPGYYRRFGFDTEIAQAFTPPYPLTYPFGWQAVALRPTTGIGQQIPIACVPALRNPALW